jgi:hypothetical protein
VLGLAPSELKDGDPVYIGGLNFDLASQLAVTLTDSATNEQWAVPIQQLDPNRLKVKPPKPSTLPESGRRLYYLRVNDNNIVAPAAELLWMRDTNGSQLPGDRIYVDFVRWLPGWVCTRNANLQNSPGPYVRSCTGFDFLHTSAIQLNNLPQEVFPNSSAFWNDWQPQFDDADREWSAVCSPAWGGPTVAYVRGLKEETGLRPTLFSYRNYFLNVDPLDPSTAALAKRTRASVFNGELRVNDETDFCKLPPGSGSNQDVVIPTKCSSWKPNGTEPHTINVHLVGAFYEGPFDEVDPTVSFNGLANPPSTFVTPEESRGMILLTDNPFLGARQRILHVNDFIPGYEDPQSRVNRSFWPNTRPIGSTPNLFAHELHHVLTGHLHSGTPEPCGTLAVGDPSPNCPRGFAMRLSAQRTVLSECAVVNSGFGGRDYTR